MASTLKKEYENKVLKALFKNETFTPATETWIALYTVEPTRTTTGTEAAYTSYKRVKNPAANWTLVEGTETEAGYLKNAAEIKFPECTGSESEVKAVGITTAESAGEQIAVGSSTETKKITTGTTPVFAAGELILKLS
jgi:hypothetical protein